MNLDKKPFKKGCKNNLRVLILFADGFKAGVLLYSATLLLKGVFLWKTDKLRLSTEKFW